MKTKKLFSIVLAAVLLMTACGTGTPTPVRYDHPIGLSLTMWEGFEVKDYEGFTGGYENRDQGICMIMAEELYESLANVGIDPEMTLAEYGQLINDSYNTAGTVGTDALGNTYFTYEREVQGGQASYFAYLYQNDVAFWTITFMCAREKADAMAEEFASWAATVELPTQAVGEVYIP